MKRSIRAAVPQFTRHPLTPEELDRAAIVTRSDVERVIESVQSPLLRQLLNAKHVGTAPPPVLEDNATGQP